MHPVALVRGIEVGQWLVHQHHLGLHRQRPRQQHALALAARELGHGAVAQRPGLRALQGRLHHRVVVCAGCSQPALVGQAPQHGHLVAAQVGHHRFALPQPGQVLRPAAGRPILQRLAQQLDLPLAGPQPRQSLQQGGLARAIGADHRRPCTLGHRQCHLVQN